MNERDAGRASGSLSERNIYPRDGRERAASVLKQKDGSMFLPIFTDILELNKFAKGKKMKVTAVPAEKIPQVLFPEAKGVVINPVGANVQLRVARAKKPTEQ